MFKFNQVGSQLVITKESDYENTIIVTFSNKCRNVTVVVKQKNETVVYYENGKLLFCNSCFIDESIVADIEYLTFVSYVTWLLDCAMKKARYDAIIRPLLSMLLCDSLLDIGDLFAPFFILSKLLPECSNAMNVFYSLDAVIERAKDEVVY